MKKTFTLKKTLIVASCILVVSVFLNSCGVTQSLFSKGRSEFSLANDEINKGNGLKALDHAFNAILIDPEVVVFKKFMYTHFDATLSKTNAFLSSSENTKVIAQAEKRVETYQMLETVFSKLKQVDLPFVHPKGKWEWTAKFIDYSKQTLESTKYAFNLIMNQGEGDMEKSLIKDSYEKFSKAYNRYCSSDKRNETAQKITTYYTDFASLKEKSTDIPTLELAHEAWGYALKFTPSLTKASNSKAKIAIKIAGLYYKNGLKLLASKNVDDNIKSIDQFNLTLKWKPNHLDAKKSIEVATEKIANFYYMAAIKMEKVSKKDKEKIIALYRNAQKWIPNFKDSMYRIYSLNVGSELITLKKNLAETRKQYTALTNRIETISGSVNKGYDAMEAITYVSGQTRSLNTKMKNVGSTLKSLTLIPVVGTVSGITSKSLSIAQKPVGGLVNKFNAIEKPFITPTKSAVEQVKNTVDAIKGMVATSKVVLEKTESTVADIDNCIKNLHLESDFKKVEAAIKEVNKGLSGTANQMKNLNTSLTRFEKGAKALAVLHSPAQKIKNGLKKIKPTLDKASKVTHEMDKVLKKEFDFKFTKMSLHKALNATGFIAEGIAKVGMKVAKPIMNKMKISFPKVPGVDELKGKLDVVKNEFQKIKTETEKVKESYQKYTSFESLISKNVNKIVETTGCGNRIGTMASK